MRNLVNDNRNTFLLNRSDLEGRLEAEFYRPEICKIERKIRQRSTKKLGDFIVKISSGATPSVVEEEKFYTTKEYGFPFLRVQNLQTNGKINLDDLKYINPETHENYLRRSQVTEGDLLIKITGVGRMAIASVAPQNFIGNTNQHMVVIKTKDRDTSDYLAKYLNLDIIEKLASRRATGATRPALDYVALKSIPVIENLNFSILDNAEKEKQKKENEAHSLLHGIDDYLMSELGIKKVQESNVLQNRIFKSHLSEISGDRFDPKYISSIKQIIDQETTYPVVHFKHLLSRNPQYGANEEAIDGNRQIDVRYIRITDIDEWGNLRHDTWKTAKNVDPLYVLGENDILIARSGATAGKSFLYKPEFGKAIFAGYLIRFFLNLKLADPNFIFFYLNSSFYKRWVLAIQRPSAQPNINAEEFKSLPIPLPPKDKQFEIATLIQSIRNDVENLLDEGTNIVQEAKQKIESEILEGI